MLLFLKISMDLNEGEGHTFKLKELQQLLEGYQLGRGSGSRKFGDPSYSL
jgi:hypothetical protein